MPITEQANMETLQSLKPAHDTPVGVIHPYWARKPLNIITWLLESFSRKGDVVIDPFSGSGTTVTAALLSGRRCIAADINPLSTFLSTAIGDLAQASAKTLGELEAFVEAFEARVLPWFRLGDSDSYVERERYEVVGSFEHGAFELRLTGVTAAQVRSGKFLKRKVVEASGYDPAHAVDQSLLASPIDFDRLELLENSRIAVPAGATLAHYFTTANRAAINLALTWIETQERSPEARRLLRLLLSSSLPLLRLSDKKASSQWPYWRPKAELTSRNPVMVFRKRLEAIRDAVEWLQEQAIDVEPAQVVTSAIGDLVPGHLAPETADLLLTDPPYSDHVPYLEYSSLWIKLLGLPLPEDIYRKEIVKTDAPSRQEDTRDYLNRLAEALAQCAVLVKPGGHCIWFYQDRDLRHWAEIWRTASANGLRFVDVIPLPKQRRSMKTVTSPGRTFDGDLILVWEKVRDAGSPVAAPFPENPLGAEPPATFYDTYAHLLKQALLEGWIEALAAKYQDVHVAIREMTGG